MCMFPAAQKWIVHLLSSAAMCGSAEERMRLGLLTQRLEEQIKLKDALLPRKSSHILPKWGS